jgi:hypothetical protein
MSIIDQKHSRAPLSEYKGLVIYCGTESMNTNRLVSMINKYSHPFADEIKDGFSITYSCEWYVDIGSMSLIQCIVKHSTDLQVHNNCSTTREILPRISPHFMTYIGKYCLY